MTVFNTAAFAVALDRALRSDAVTSHLAPHVSPHLPMDTVINRAVLALLNEFSRPWIEPMELTPAVPLPSNRVGHINRETGEITELPVEPAAPEELQVYDGPAEDAPVAQRATEQPDDEPAVEVEDLGAAKLSALADRLETFFRQPQASWVEATRGTVDSDVPQLVREGNARFFDSAQHHHPAIFDRLKAIVAAGRVAP